MKFILKRVMKVSHVLTVGVSMGYPTFYIKRSLSLKYSKQINNYIYCIFSYFLQIVLADI